jgi:cytochrome c-type biogenesis protein CcmH/NrfG
LIGDLETAVAGQRQPLLQRVLGDAYMRNGQLQKALDTYRDALDRL